MFRHQGALPDLSPAGKYYPFSLHVAPLGSGAQVIEDERVWAFVSKAMRKTLALEMEGAALGEIAHRQRQYNLDALVMKGVMDFANHGRDDHFKEFAARASAECLLWFLRARVPTELTAGFDDLLNTGTASPPAKKGRAPSFLLSARHTIVPWHDGNRAAVMEELDAWADDGSRDVAVRLLHGDAGAGKTRLAIEWVRRRRAQHQVAGFLTRQPDIRWLERLCSIGPPVLVVVDYAETRPDLISLVTRVAAFASGAGARRRVHLLLLARGAGDWWAELRRSDTEVGTLLDLSEPIMLSPLAVTVAEREIVFAQAVKAFSDGREVLAAQPPPPLEDPTFGCALYLHMAALASVEGLSLEAQPITEAILDHEERLWQRDSQAVSIDVSLARGLVAAATLRGGLPTLESAQGLFVRMFRRARARADDELIALLHRLYERPDTSNYLPGLEPDLLGEAMVLRVAAPQRGSGTPADESWIERVFSDNEALFTGFAVLGRAATTNAEAVRPWITRLLRTHLAARSVAALRAAKAVGRRTAFSPIGDILAETLEARGTRSLAFELEPEYVPEGSVSLRRLEEWLTRMLVEGTTRSDDDHLMALRAARLNRRAGALGDAGRHEEALSAMRESADLFLRLAEHDVATYLPMLSTSWINLAAKLSAMGQRDEALGIARLAALNFKLLANRSEPAFAPGLAMSMGSFGAALAESGNREAALLVTRKSVDAYRRLAADAPGEFDQPFANSLIALGNRLAALQQRTEALKVTREAASILRKLATRNPDAVTPTLAGVLNVRPRGTPS